MNGFTPATRPGGSSGQIQWNSSGAFGGAAGATYASSGTHLLALAQSGSVVPLAAQATTGQTAAIFETRAANGNVIAQVQPGGMLLLRNPAFDGSRAGVFLRYQRDSLGICDIMSDDPGGSFTFNPSNSIQTIGATNVTAGTYYFRGNTTNPCVMGLFNAGALRDGLQMDQQQTPSAAPIGHYLLFSTRRSSGGAVNAARSGAGLTDVSATWKSFWELLVSDSVSSNRTALRAEADGSAVRLGFYGATPVIRPTLPGAGVVTADDIRTALINLGLCQ